MAQTPYDYFAKSLLVERGSALGIAVTEYEIVAEAQLADLQWTPGEVLPPPRDLLDRVLAEEALIEFFHQPPGVEDLLGCLRKLLAWHALRCNAARARDSSAAVDGRPGDAARGAR